MNLVKFKNNTLDKFEIFEKMCELDNNLIKKVKVENIEKFVDYRLEGRMCSCSTGGTFDLIPLDDLDLDGFSKRYMICRNCGEHSHL